MGVYAGISLGVFLFIMFFQPFTTEKFDSNDRLLFHAGLGAITFLLIVLIRSVFPGQFQNNESYSKGLKINTTFRRLILLVLNTLAFVFYLRYVGGIHMSFYLVFKIFLVSLAPLLILNYYDLFRELKKQNKEQLQEIRTLQNQVKIHSTKDKTIPFVSLTSRDKLNLPGSGVVMIRSADNYVEIFYYDETGLKRKMLRNTLKNIEYQLMNRSNFLRCHRTCIVNINFAKDLKRKYNSYLLELEGMDEPIAVSRQYLMRVKDALAFDRDE